MTRYVRCSDLAEQYSVSRSMVTKIIDEMITSQRYPPTSIIGGKRCRRIDPEAFLDYMTNREFLNHPIMRKTVKPYKGG